jgi:hypothetical protein
MCKEDGQSVSTTIDIKIILTPAGHIPVGRPENVLTTVEDSALPILLELTSSFTLMMRGLARACNSTMVLTPFALASSANCSASLGVASSGHSTKTSFPASRVGLVRK